MGKELLGLEKAIFLFDYRLSPEIIDYDVILDRDDVGNYDISFAIGFDGGKVEYLYIDGHSLLELVDDKAEYTFSIPLMENLLDIYQKANNKALEYYIEQTGEDLSDYIIKN